MNPRVSRWPILSTCALLVSFAGGTARADDTEVYVGQPTTAADGRPNVLFIIDTSGSMDGDVDTQEAFDPAQIYSGKCSANRIYWKKSTAGLDGPPVDEDCKRLANGDNDKVGWVDVGKFVCKTAKDIIDRNGFQPVTRTAQWAPVTNTPANSKWTALKHVSGGNQNPIECADDSDLTKISPAHGDGTKPYAANGTNGPFTTDGAQKLNWSGSSDTTGTYTYYSSNYLNWYYNAQFVTKTRLQIVKDVAEKTLNSISDVNVGLMRFSTDGQGGMVMHPIAELATSRGTLVSQIDALNPNGNTPLAETLYESTLYWTGGTWDYGKVSSPQVSVRSSRTSADDQKYLAPISSSCQKNFIVYLTDGEPVSDTGANTKILNLPGFKTTVGATCTANAGSGASNDNGKCLDDLAEYLYKTDLSSSQPGLQNVTTYTVGFGADVQGVAWATQLLRDTARRGGGSFYEAKDTATLTSVFTSIVQEILAVNTTFTAPTVAVNAFNRTQNLNDLFITLFGTSSKYHWPGNVKKYEVQTDGTIVGTNGPAVNPATGFFKDGARSFWSSGSDGAEVAAGGAAHMLPTPATRKVSTDIAGAALSGAGNSVEVSTTAITAEMLGGLDPVDTPALTRDTLIEWVRGADIDAVTAADRVKPRFDMGDPLHARPTTVIYGGTATSPDMVLYAATNDGYVHAINPSDGTELWSYIPGHLLRRMTDLYLDKGQPAKRYGLDGTLRALKIDVNGNGTVDTSDGDKVYLFFGMGRGGQSYFGLDVTNKNAPRLIWRRGAATEILADGTTLPASQQIAGLGQTWSTPVATQVKIGSTVKPVLIVGGGYDTSQDNVGQNTDDSGNRVLMLDALTGDQLWSSDQVAFTTGVSIQHSIPGDIRVLDLDGNGLADRMYAADMGGRIWRFDINNGSAAGSSLVTGGMFASLGHADGAGADPADSRRFYYAPDVSLVRNGTQVFLNIAIGSGYRGHPLNKQINDRFYSLRDYQPFTAKTQAQYNAFTPISESNAKLIDVTGNITPTMPPDAVGWRINLEGSNGEKVLAEARTFDNKILFTSYLPNQGAVTPGSNSCVARQGINRLYTVQALDGRPVVNREGGVGPDGKPLSPDSPTDRWGELSQSGIAPEPVILFPETSTPTCIVGVEQCGVGFSNNPVRTFWNRQDTDSGN
jgi:type IV pilus assembly protein PilY1